MDEPSRTVNPACMWPHRAHAGQGLVKKKLPVEIKLYHETLLPENLCTDCRARLAGKATAEVQMFVEANSKPQGIVTYMDGSTTRDRCGRGSQSSRVEGLYTKTVVSTES